MQLDEFGGMLPPQEEVQAQWEAYRASCFMWNGLTAWYYTAAEAFDYATAAFHLRYVQDASIDAGTHAVCIKAFGHNHLVRISRLNDLSAEILAPQFAFDLHTVRSDLLADELRSSLTLREITLKRYQIIFTPGVGHVAN